MDNLIKQYNQLYPNFKTTKCKNDECLICEAKIQNNEKDLLSLKIVNFTGEQFPYELAGGSTSFYTKAGCPDPMKANCDGIVCTTINGRESLLLCELKSSFSVEGIFDAKEQIVGSYMRLKAQMSILQANKNCELHGLIVSYLPKTEQLTKIKTLTDRKAKFAMGLYSLGIYDMEDVMCKRFYFPIDVPGIHLHYFGVPIGKQHYEISANELFKMR